MLPDSSLFSPLFSDDAMRHIFSDEIFVESMVSVESLLAQVQGELGIVPQTAVSTITNALPTFTPDYDQLKIGIEKAGVPVSELVRQMRQHIGAPAASYIHWGATTQDIMDTAVIIQMRTAFSLLEPKLQQIILHLAPLANNHRHTIMAGRTHSQQALPTTFGLKVAGWLTPLLRHQERLAQLKPRLLVVQFGGAAGTLASLGEQGLAVQQNLADRLSLGTTQTPWHTQRDNLAECAGWLALVCGSLAKIAQDIILLAQTEVGELRESADTSRGGSSTMPQKSNPIISEGIIAIARANANLLATMHQALVQEHERATHGWQMEWLTLPQMFVHTAVSLNKALFLSQNLVVNKEKMAQNVDLSQGLMMAEPLSLALAPELGRTEAKALIKEACQQAFAEQRHLVDVVQEKTAVSLDWAYYRNEANYLGTANDMIDQVLEQVWKKSGNPL